MYKMQQMVGMVGMYEGTEDEEYDRMKDMARNLREGCKKVQRKLEVVAEGSDELVGNMRDLANAMLHKYLLNKESTGMQPPNKALVAVARDLGGMEFGEGLFKKCLEECAGLVDTFCTELKQLEDYRDTRRKKREAFDYCKYELRIKTEALDRKGKPHHTSKSYLKKKAAHDEALTQYNDANEATKRHMKLSISRRDAILANLIQVYLKGCSNHFLALHRKFAELHDMTMIRGSPLPSPRSPPIEQQQQADEEAPYREYSGDVLCS
eukprot:TRINITY_DN33920_c0_g1_i1.p1 TRINITY_DN33920_c0_g1~~TRINITY_DN33920_c0_g1_i1.p1  ORF type:complete len:266 (+),score=93.74 TRINITY_DN33920_c0_g1_i1:155-952(+)